MSRAEDEELMDLLDGAWCGHRNAPGPPSAPAHAVGAIAAAPDAAAPAAAAAAAAGASIQPGTTQLVGNTNVSENMEVGNEPSVCSEPTFTGRSDIDSDIGTLGTNSTYLQCKAARTHTLKQPTIDCNMGSNTGTSYLLQHERVGSLAIGGDTAMAKTFRGSRIATGERTVNQNIATSFDPLTLICTCCVKPHSILPSDGTGLVIVVSDQNFATTVVGSTACLPIIRVEDATLRELFDLTLEVLNRTVIPVGTLFLVGSLSHLVKVGTTVYSLDWQQVVNKYGERWPNCRVGPLPPVLREDSPGETGRNIVELRHWLSQVYTGTNSILFIKGAWDMVVKGITSGIYPHQDLDHVETYTIATPISLSSTCMHPLKLSKSSSHAITAGFDVEVSHELILALLQTLSTDFGCKANPEDLLLVRAPAEGGGGVKDTPSVPVLIVIGASHMSRVVPHLRTHAVEVIDLSVPGWKVTDRNVKQLVEEIGKLGHIDNAIGILDLASNTTFRYENPDDGTLSLPYKHDGRYHMDGKVTTSTPDMTQTLLDRAGPLLDAIPGLKVCIPPLPRYLRTPCCDTDGHCDGMNDPDYVTELIGKTLGVRKQMRDHLINRGGPSCWVPDTVRMLVPGINSTAEIGIAMCDLSAEDGVHLIDSGYRKLAETIIETVHTRTLANSDIAGKSEKGRSFYWRGFTSPVGSARAKNTNFCYKETHPGGGKWKDQQRNKNRNLSLNPSARGRGGYPGPSGRNWN